MTYTNRISLVNIFVNRQRQIGIDYKSNKVINALVKQFKGVKWSKKHNMVFVLNTRTNLNKIFETFRGVAWVNCAKLYANKPINTNSDKTNLDYYRNRDLKKDVRRCPDEFINKLEIKRYSANTCKIYISFFELFINHYKLKNLLDINENDIREYLMIQVRNGRSNSYLNQMVNSIKFYYEIVLEMPNRFYLIERPRKTKSLPKVVSKEKIIKMIKITDNIKHKCIICLLYSSGLRLSELLSLKINDIDSDRMMIRVVNAKGNKDRYTILSIKLLTLLRKYYLEYKPRNYLFEGTKGGVYSASSVQAIIKRAATKAGIIEKISPHMLRHSFATHLLENDTNLRYIQSLLGHSNSKTTEIYTHVAKTNIKNIKSPLD